MTADNNDPRMAQSLEEQLDDAEELITGDSDDPPLSEEAVLEMIRSTHMPKPSGSRVVGGWDNVRVRGSVSGTLSQRIHS